MLPPDYPPTEILDLDSELRPEVASVLRVLIPHFKDNRDKWPLWTCSHETWLSLGEHPLTIRPWTPEFVLGTHGIGLGHETLEGFSPLGQASVAAAAVATAWEVPEHLNKAWLPEFYHWSSLGLLPSITMVQNFQRWLTWNGSGLVTHYDEAAPSASQRRTAGLKEGSQPAEPATHAFVYALAKELGLVFDRADGQRVPLSNTTLKLLFDEAQELILTVRDWEPSAELLEALIILLKMDSAIEAERAKRNPTEAPMKLARRLAFPFLLEGEHQHVLRNPAATKGPSRGLIRSRMIEDVSDATMRRCLSSG